MKNLKRALSFALATVMLIGMMVVGASASFTDAEDIENVDAVNTLVALGIINGKADGSFDPTGTVTRAEMAKMICVALNGGKDPNFTGVGLYPDTKGHWAAGYIDYCTNLGIVAGDTAGNFNPDKAVTGTEAAKMLLIALGFNAETEKFVNDASWALNIDRRATEKELYDDVSSLPAAALSRDNAAQMIFNALDAYKVKYEMVGIINGNSVSAAEDTDKTILNNTFKVDEYEGDLTAISYDADDEKYTYTIVGEDKDGKDVEKKWTSENDYSDLFMMNSKVLYKEKNGKNEVYGIFAEDSSVVATGIIDDISTKNLSKGELKIDGTAYDCVKDVKAYAFNDEEAVELANVAKYFDMKAIDNDNDGEIDHIVYVDFDLGKIDLVGRKTFKVTVDGKTDSYDLDDETIVLYDDMAEDDYVKVTTDLEGNTVYEKIDTIAGKVSAQKDGDVKIDGEWYTPVKDMTTGKSYKNMPVVNGFILDTTDKGTSSAKVEEYAVVTAIEAEATGLNTNPRAVLLLTTGEKITVDLVVVEDEDGNVVPYDKALIGDLVIYDVDDDEYTLEEATDEAFDGAAEKKVYKSKKIDGMTIADDAIIFMSNSKETSFKVITGADLKKTDSIDVNAAYYETNDTTGFKTVTMAYVKGSITSTTDNLYGYVVSKAGEDSDEDDEIVHTIDVWNGEEVVTLTSEDEYEVTEGDLVVYQLDNDDLVSRIKKITKPGAIDEDNEELVAELKAVVAYADDEIMFAGDSTVYDITEDTVILYINSEDVEGVAEGKIILADEVEESDPVKYIPNVYVAVDKDKDEVVLLIVDDANEMEDFEA